MKVSIVGTGYVGLITGACLAEKGRDVICVDVDEARVAAINAGQAPIYEPGLSDLLARHVGRRLRATSDIRSAVHDTDLSMICVGTPFDGENIDLRFIRQAASDIGTALRDKPSWHLVVVKSTVIPGTTDDVVGAIVEETSGKMRGAGFGLAMNPEFLREGEAVSDFMFPDRIVLGGIDDRSRNLLRDLYSPFPQAVLLPTSARSAEMIKYASNSLLATLISFSNEIANVCAQTDGVDVVEVLKAVHLDRRLSVMRPDGERITPAVTTYIEAGCGFGGSCFPKDVRALIAYGKSHGRAMDLLDAVMKVNEKQPGETVQLLKDHFKSVDGLPVAVLGIAFKPGTDDVRESPGIPIVRDLLAEGADVRVFDPVATEAARGVLNDARIRYSTELEEAVQGAKAIFVVTRWPEFQKLPELLPAGDEAPLVIDARRALPRHSVARYTGIGLRTPAGTRNEAYGRAG